MAQINFLNAIGMPLVSEGAAGKNGLARSRVTFGFSRPQRGTFSDAVILEAGNTCVELT